MAQTSPPVNERSPKDWMVSSRQEGICHAVFDMGRDVSLSSLYSFLDKSEEDLSDLQSVLAVLNSDLRKQGILQAPARKLGRLCLDADSWGFDDLHMVARETLFLVLDLDEGVREWSADVAAAAERGLAMLSTILHECESGYRRRLAIADLLDSLSQAGKN